VSKPAKPVGMTRYRFPYGWTTYETTRAQPGVLSHAVITDRAGEVSIEWCGSLYLAAQEANRVRALCQTGSARAVVTISEVVESPV
jgi:hypothetical protein